MNLSLYSAATGMEAQQLNLNTIANNLANVNTPGFKRSKIEFQDLLYQKPRAVGSDSGSSVSVLLGHDSQPLALDAATGLRIAAGRGNISGSSDGDYWSFTGQAGDVFTMATENPGNPGSSSLLYLIYRPGDGPRRSLHPEPAN